MKQQIRTYILAVGRDNDDQPVRKLANYTGRPLKGLGDQYHLMDAPELNRLEEQLQDEWVQVQHALEDIHDEKVDRIGRLVNRDTNASIREAIRNA